MLTTLAYLFPVCLLVAALSLSAGVAHRRGKPGLAFGLSFSAFVFAMLAAAIVVEFVGSLVSR